MRLHIHRRCKMLLLFTGLLLTSGLLTACSPKSVPSDITEAETVQESTEDPFSLGDVEVKVDVTDTEPDTEIERTVEIIEEGGLIGVNATGETVYDMGRYGDLGETFFQSLAECWVDWTIETEEDLRSIMNDAYGNLSTKEELTQEILAMERDSRPQAVVQETQAPTPETQAVVQESQAPTPETKAHTQETKVASNETEVQQPTQVAPQQSEVSQPQEVSQTLELPPDVQAMVDANKAWQEAGGCSTGHAGGSPTDIVDDLGGVVLH